MTGVLVEPRQSAAATTVDVDRVLVAGLAVFFAVRPALDLIVTYELGPNLNFVTGGLVLAICVSWLAREVARPDFRLGVASASALALGAAAALSSLGADDAGFAATMALRVITSALVFVVCEQLFRRSAREAWWLVGGIVFGMASTAPVALGQLAGWVPVRVGDSLDITRVPGPFPAPTVFATCMFIAVVVIVAFAPELWRRSSTAAVFAVAVALGFGILILVNGSRSPLGAAVLAVIVVLVGQRRAALLAPMAVGSGLVVLAQPSLVARAVEIFQFSDDSVILGAEVNTFAFRLRYWEQNLPRFEESPWVGLGLGRVEQVNSEGFPPHSTTLQALLEMGIVGLAAHYVLVIALAVVLVRSVRRAETERARAFTSCALALCAGYFVMSFFENLLTQVVTTAPIAAIAGAAIGIAHADAGSSGRRHEFG